MEHVRVIFLFFACCVLMFLPFQTLAQVDTYEFDPDFNCVDRGNFTANSSFAGNLNRLVSSLSSLTSKPYGFYNLSSGDSSGEKAYAIGLCRREVKRDDCLRCIQTAARNLTEQCPRSKQAVVWYTQCMFRYSNRTIYGRKETDPKLSYRAGEKISSNIDEFERLQRELLNRLKGVAAAGGGNRKYAQGNSSASPGYRRFYGSAQCTPDLSEEDCNDCLIYGFESIPSCCDSEIGLRWFCPSCNFRFETWRFYEFEADLELDPPGSAGSPTPAAKTEEKTGKGKGGSKVVIAIVIPIVLVALFGICLCLVWRSWREDVILSVIDPSLTAGSRNDILRCLHIGLLCVQESAASRPTMASVALMLNSNSFTLPTPSRPAFVLESVIPSNVSSSTEGLQMSSNDVTVSELSPQNDPSPGNFSLGVDPSGAPEIVLWGRNNTRRWRSGQWNSAIFTGIPNMALLTNYLYGFKLSSPPDETGSVYFTYVPSDPSVLLRFKVLHNGTEEELRWNETSKRWTKFQAAPESECDKYNRCGSFGESKKTKIVVIVAVLVGVLLLGIFALLLWRFKRKKDVSGTYCGHDADTSVVVVDMTKAKDTTTAFTGSVDIMIEGKAVNTSELPAWFLYTHGRSEELVDPKIRATCNKREALRCIHVAMLCVQDSAAERPNMAAVLLMLESDTATLPVPRQPTFTTSTRRNSMDVNFALDSSQQYIVSSNEITSTVVLGR
ncbi:hypothetical protein Bca4012_087587 [Brassica carinata]